MTELDASQEQCRQASGWQALGTGQSRALITAWDPLDQGGSALAKPSLPCSEPKS